MRQHPALGHLMLRRIEFLDEARRVVLHHRERWDGAGHPAGLAGEAIAEGARVFAVAEAVDRILGGEADADLRAEIEREAGQAFDPRVVEACLRLPAAELAAAAHDPAPPVSVEVG